jgi:hypothetical protein
VWIPQPNPLEQSTYTSRNEGQENKTGTVGGWAPVGRKRINGEGEGGWIWSMYFVYVYENWIIKSIKIVLRSGECDNREWGRSESN